MWAKEAKDGIDDTLTERDRREWKLNEGLTLVIGMCGLEILREICHACR